MNVPKLRFPGFDGEWEEGTLGDLFTIFNGYAFSSSDSSSEGIPWVKIADVGIQEMKLDSLSYLPENFLEEYSKFRLVKGDVVVALTRPILNGKLKIAVIDSLFHNSLLNQRVGKLQSDNDLMYCYFLLQQDPIIKLIENNIAGSDPPNLAPSEIKSISISLPTLPEQQKIASFLSSVDNVIQLLTKKKTLLEKYKKGVMQKIFSQEIRFKDDNENDFPDWEEKRLGEIGSSFTGLSGKSSEDFGTGYPFITYKQIFDSSQIDTSKFSYVQIEPSEKQNTVKFGDFFFTTSSETPEEVGFASVLLNEVENTYLNSFCFGFRLNSFYQFLPHFGRYLFRSPLFREKVVLLAQGSTRYNISKSEFMKLRISLPSLPEQKKIADFLSGIDRSIEVVNSQVEKTKMYKKGLLQQMFV